MSFNTLTPVVTAGQQQPSAIRRQVTLTQTITYPDLTTTAVVTLDRGGPPTDSPTPPSWSAGDTSSGGLSQQQIGIIVGCLVGALVLGILLWCCCTNRCGCQRYSVYDDDSDQAYYQAYYQDDTTEITHPRRTYWPSFPQSIPPPAQPTYVATDAGPGWTAYQAMRRINPNYNGG
ncbi:hypothetical protein AAE478_009044 [Parahypoxylon ruwenzoriense]